MTVQDVLVQNLTQRMMRFRRSLEQFGDATAEQASVGPRWNVRDLAGHMAFWAGTVADQIDTLRRGGRSHPQDIEKTNDEVYRRNRHMSFVMLLPQLRSAEERLLTAVRAVPPAALIDSEIRELIDEAVRHYDHHWPSLNAAMKAAN